MRLIIAAVVLLGLTGLAEAHSTSSCLNSAACKNAAAAAVAAAEARAAAQIAALKAQIAELSAGIPCTAFARSAEEAGAFIGRAGTFCVVIQGVEKCNDGDFCAKFETQP